MFNSKSSKSDGGIGAFLGPESVYTGKLEFEGCVRVDGRFTGEIIGGMLIIGDTALIDGKVFVEELQSAGSINGEVVASKRVSLARTALMRGTLRTPLLTMEEGATLKGDVDMESVQPALTGEDAQQELITEG